MVFFRVTTLLLLLAAVFAALIIFNVGSRVQRYFYGVKPGVTLEGKPMAGMLEKEAVKHLEKLASVIDRAPQNASYERKTDEIIQEVPGMEVDINVTLESLMTAEKDESVELVIIILEPELTAELFKSINEKLSSYGTSGGGSAGRTDNLYVSAKYMNNTILAPGDVFSFNEVTGPRTFERGYSMAPVVGGMGIGGGVCQTATTVYNAARLAGMEIIERHQHSIRVGYVPPGRDATVTNYIDFKFRNSTDQFIQIRSGAGGGHVWVQIWGQSM